jgi:hypothetical protein
MPSSAASFEGLTWRKLACSKRADENSGSLGDLRTVTIVDPEGTNELLSREPE